MDTFSGKAVSLEELLNAKEARWQRIQGLNREHQCPIICLTLNIPGPVKQLPQGDTAFEAGANALSAALLEEKIPFARAYREITCTGYTSLFIVPHDPVELKKIACQIEESHPLGRILDIDVYDEKFNLVSRADLSLPPRKCLLCGKPAHECTRSQAHSLGEVKEAVTAIFSAATS